MTITANKLPIIISCGDKQPESFQIRSATLKYIYTHFIDDEIRDKKDGVGASVLIT